MPLDPHAADPAGEIPAVALMRPEQAEALVRASEANSKLMWTDGAVEAAWELAHGHPYMLQHLCWHVGERTRAKVEASEQASRTKRCAVCGQVCPVDSPKCSACSSQSWHNVVRSRVAATREDVEAVVPATLEASRRTLERLWEGLPPGMRAVSWVLARTGAEAMPEERLRRLFTARGMLEAARDPAKAARSVEGWDLLETVDGGYRLRVDLLRRWIAARDAPEGALELAEALEPARELEDAGTPSPEVRGEDPTGGATGEAAGRHLAAPQIAAAPEGSGAGGRDRAGKKRAGRSIAPWVGAAALAMICVFLGWVARGGLGGAAPTPSAAVPPATDSVTGPSEAPASDDDGSSLPPGRGYLVVDSTGESGVFAFGTFIGLTGRRLEVSCGTKFLRLGVPPDGGSAQPGRVVWTGPGKSANVACKALTRVSLTPTK